MIFTCKSCIEGGSVNTYGSTGHAGEMVVPMTEEDNCATC